LDIPGLRQAWLRWRIISAHREAGRTSPEHGNQVRPAPSAAEPAPGLQADLGIGRPAVLTRQLLQLAEGFLVADAAGDGHDRLRCRRLRAVQWKCRMAVADRRQCRFGGARRCLQHPPRIAGGHSAEDAAREVAIAPIAGDEDHHPLVQPAGHLQSCPAGAAGAWAGEQAHVARQSARGLIRIALGDVDDLIDALRFVEGRQVGRRPAADARDLAPGGGLAADDLDLGIALLEEAAGAHDGPGGAHGGDEMGDRPLGIAPDLGAGAGIVRERIVGIAELVEHEEGIGLLGGGTHLLLGPVTGLLHAAIDEMHGGAERLHGLSALDRQGVGHHQVHLDADRPGDHRQGDAGVAARRFDQAHARPQQAPHPRAEDHPAGGTILDARGWVVPFAFRQDADALASEQG